MKMLKNVLLGLVIFFCLTMISGCFLCELFPSLCTSPPKPQLAIFPASLDFGTQESSMTFDITNVGDGTLNWNISDNRQWISVNPTNGSATSEKDTITVTADRNAANYGTHYGSVQVSSNGGALIVSVSMTREPGGLPYIQAREGNNCTQNNCGGASYVSGSSYNFKQTSAFENDEARSFVFHWLPIGARIRVYDDPSGGTNDDWTEVRIKKVVAEYCLGTLENTYEDDVVVVTHTRNNGLDGKVSHLKMN